MATWQMRMALLAALMVTVAPAWAANPTPVPLVAQGAQPGDERVTAEQADGEAAEENPWSSVIKSPMYVPFPWDALLDGWVPWGRFAWVKNLTGLSFIGCGVMFIGLFPFSLALAVISIALAVLGLALAAYMFVTSGMNGDLGGMCRSGNDGAQSCFSLYNGVMCLSFVACWPWLGFKLAQRGVYALQTDLDPPEEKPARRKGKAPRRDVPLNPDEEAPESDGSAGVEAQSYRPQAY